MLAENMKEFLKTHQVIDEQPAWDAGQRGVLTAERAREEGFCKRTAESPAELASIYQIGGRSAVEDPTLGQTIRRTGSSSRACSTTSSVSFLSRNIEQARQQKKNLFILQINSPGGIEAAGDRIGRHHLRDQGHEDGRLCRRPCARRRGPACRWPAATSSSRRARGWATSARSSAGATGMLHDLSETARAEPGQEGGALGPGERAPRGRRRRHGRSRRRDHRSQGLADRGQPADPALRGRSRPRPVPDRSRLARNAGIGADGHAPRTPRRSDWARSSATTKSSRPSTACAAAIRVDGPGWVDSLVTILTDPYVSWLLLFVGAVHAGHRAQAARHRPAGDHLGPGISPLLLEPLLERHGRPARDHPVLDRPGQPGASRSSSFPASASSA